MAENLLKDVPITVLTIILTGDYKVIYQQFLEREISPDGHRKHVVNNCYPEKKERNPDGRKAASIIWLKA